jgi:primosomal protein N' (replication factor Y)
MARLLDVALPVPLFRTFSYTWDERARPEVPAGTRVVVSVRNRKEIGIVVGTRDEADGLRAYKAILDFPDDRPVFSAALLATLRWISTYYVAPLGVTLRAALPVLLGSAATPAPGGKRQRVATLTRTIESLMERDALFKRSPRQRDVFELLEQIGGQATVSALVAQLGVSSSVVQAMADRGLVRLEWESVLRDPFAGRRVEPPPSHTPTVRQAHAVGTLTALAPQSTALLHGVTGSGKTLVYLEFLRHVLRDPLATAIVLVPEIALTPQTVSRFRAVFGNNVAVLHSALSDGERLDAWRALERGERRIAIGARSAIFAPLASVRAIIVDEEHESSYKQNESPRYHARDVAVVRGRFEGAVVVLGSATPSLESWEHARAGRYHLLSLPDRVGGGTLPSVEVVDLRSAAAQHAATSAPVDGARVAAPPQQVASRDPFARVISPPLERALRDRMGRGEQSILLLNRRGYASFLQCQSCGDVVDCPNCSISLTRHRTPERLMCHYCTHAEPVPTRCRRCAAETVRSRGLGTQQVERLLGERIPSIRIARMDLDTTSGKWAHADILDRVAEGSVDVLLGTQMIAKGLDFPNVTLVGVIDADVGINLPDFRAGERTFQLLSQVAGRAGRSAKAGHVIVQTRMASHHAVRCAVAHDYETFVTIEREERLSPPYPPTNRLANVIVSGTDEGAVATTARDVTTWLHRLQEARALTAIQLIGPAPCPVERIQQRWRWHVLVKSTESRALTQVLRYLATHVTVPAQHELRLTIDRDPGSLL